MNASRATSRRNPRSLAAEASRDFAKLDLEYTEVRAPIDGRVSRAFLTEGNYVSGIAGAATKLTSIVSVDPVYVYADMDEDSLLKFNALVSQKKLETNGDGRVPVELQLGDEAEYPHRGYIESLDNQLNPNTGSILLRAVFSNDDGRIVPGLFARIRVPLSARHAAFLVSKKPSARTRRKNMSSRSHPPTPSHTNPSCSGLRLTACESSAPGLSGGEEIVVNGLQRVRPGMPVKAESVVASKGTSPWRNDNA